MDPWIELDEDALRQYIDARAVFEARESARIKAAEIRVGVIPNCAVSQRTNEP